MTTKIIGNQANPNKIYLTPDEFGAVIDKMKAKDLSGIDDKLWQAVIQNSIDWWSYLANMELMNGIVDAMKVTAKLPSEIIDPDNTHTLETVEFLNEGGMLTYMKGYDQPYRGFPYYEFVDKMDVIKKLARQIQSGFYHAFVKNRFRMFLLIPLIPSVRHILYAYAYSFHRVVQRFIVKPERYCKAVREIYRAASIQREDEDEQIKNLRIMIRDYECMLLEFDNAYRFRVQDLLSDMNKENLRKNPIKEIKRLIDIWISREQTIEVKDTWRLLKAWVSWYLRFDRKLLSLITFVLLNIDPNQTKLTVEDDYYAMKRKDYKFPLRIGNPVY